jgi:shikimate dehydrogenase
LAGWPVTHTKSPAIHNAACAELGIDAVYVPLPVRPDAASFDAFMDYVASRPELALEGLSVTMPHKVNALRWLDRHGYGASPLARRCRAVNTLVRANDAWFGENTDGPGALAALRQTPRFHDAGPRGARVAILGAGGTARAIAATLCEQGCSVTVYSRSAPSGRALAHDLRCTWHPWEARRNCTGDLLINCTPVGMASYHAGTDASPMPADALRPGTVVFDTVYDPAETQLLHLARQRGCEVVSGEQLLIAQGAAQFELWHHCSAPIASMCEGLKYRASCP